MTRNTNGTNKRVKYLTCDWMKPGVSIRYKGNVYKAMGFPFYNNNRQVWQIEMLSSYSLSHLRVDCSECQPASDNLDAMLEIVLQIPKANYREGEEVSFRLPGYTDENSDQVVVTLPEPKESPLAKSPDYSVVVVRVSGEVINLISRSKYEANNSSEKQELSAEVNFLPSCNNDSEIDATDEHASNLSIDQLITKIDKQISSLAPHRLRIVSLDPDEPLGISVHSMERNGFENQNLYLYFIVKVEPDSQSERLNLRVGDYIYKLDETLVTCMCDLKTKFSDAKMYARKENRMLKMTIVSNLAQDVFI